jgi:iron uptake system component EfeO
MTEAQAVAQGMGSDGAPVITVSATDSRCTPNVTSVKAGRVWFKLRNGGTKVNELYLENSGGDPLIEVEFVDPGKGGAFAWTVKAGSYFVACKPGMGDEKLQTPFRVTG